MNSSSKMKMNSKRELHQLYSQFVRIWKSGEMAKLNLRSENGAVKACLEINLGISHPAPTDAHCNQWMPTEPRGTSNPTSS